MSWRERLMREPGLGDMANWPVIEPTTLSPDRRKGFLTNQRLVARVLSSGSCTEVAQEFGCSKGRISQLMARCLGGDLDQPAALTMALIPHARLETPKRRQDLPSLSQPSGAAGAFIDLLAQLPGLKASLDQAILEDHKRTRHSQRLTSAHLHKHFLRWLTEAHWPRDRYPFTTTSRGAESIRRYLEDQRIRLNTPTVQRERVTDLEASVERHRALATVQIDEHLMHLSSNLTIRFNDEWIELRLPRCSLLVTVDLATQCILGFELCPTFAPDQDDLLALFSACLTRQTPPTILTPGFDIPVLPALPTELITDRPLTWGTVQMDNAWIHHSNVVEEFLCCTMGATVSLGLAGQPKTRWLVEHVFAYLEQKLGHRYDSTSGSHPKDPRRESRKNARKVPALSYQSLIEAIYLQIGLYNQTPAPNLAGQRPLEIFQRHLEEHWTRWVPGGASVGWHPFRSSIRLPVHRPRAEKRCPYVQFCYCRYTGDGLLTLAPGDKFVFIDYDRRDIRTLWARAPQGQALGPLLAPRSWRRFAHSEATRKWLHHEKRDARYAAADPITGHFLTLLDQRRTPKVAEQMLSLYLEITPTGQPWLATGDDANAARAEWDSTRAAFPPERDARSPMAWAPMPFQHPGRLP